MLKRLELVGFKSFAEKTRFDFPPGVTAIVGPNGSGKSNIVDAVRWILGEQSAKSLRGGEMADVIFNGSASRKSLGMAEVTMSFDNAKRHLNFDSDEVQITRRVYRDGTGEYLINGSMSRLKDIKEMFLGSGAGAGAYSIIEQGRVDALLQASTKERRNIFEEAAGISRFKARKIETLRKLENVDQNLSRVRDIIAEVDKQLRRVRLEASKAQRFQEYSNRLRDLRVGLGLREYTQFNERLTVETEALAALREELGQAQVQAASSEAEASRLEAELTQLEARLEETTGRLADVRQHLAAQAANLESETERGDDLERQLADTRLRAVELARHVQTAAAAAGTAGGEVQEAQDHADQQRRKVDELEQALAAVDGEIERLQKQILVDRQSQIDLVRQAGTLQTQAEGAKQQLDRFYRDREQRRRKAEQKAAELGSLERVLEDLDRTGADLQHRLGVVRQNHTTKVQERDDLRRAAEQKQQETADLNVRRSDLRGRIDILEGLERSQEGLGEGVREVMDLLKADEESSALSTVVFGLVADFLSVPRDVAPLIDLALGDAAQKFVVRDVASLETILADRSQPFAGRVSFLPLMPLEPLADGDETTTADRWVTCDHPELAGLPRQLLGNVRIVPDLPTARAMAADPEFAGCRFITRQGELLDADGTLTVGTHHAEAGILSRKSELRELRAQARNVEDDLARTEAELAKLHRQIDGYEAPLHGLEQEIELLSNQAGDLQSQILSHRQNRSRLDEEIALSKVEMQILEQEIHSLELAAKEARERAEQAELAAQALRKRLEDADRRARALDEDRVARQQAHTAAHIALAQMEERLLALRTRYEQIEADWRRGREERHRIERHEGVLHARLIECRLACLLASSVQAEGFRRKEDCERETARLVEDRDRDREQRRVLVEQLQQVRTASSDNLTALHQRELAVRDLENSLTTLSGRLREDYGIELSETQVEGTAEVGDTDAVNAEINQLRDRIRKLGNVSLESLEELKEVEARAEDLQSQHDDLASAQGSLMEIIGKINTDSRKLFSETYDTIRTNFQDLFRKLFGGGMADIVLENPEDVLESGIEINARPPGKELRSISLMSGGEKTMTAIGLLLAIFRSKPSPFCLLDEVDAALDEANTQRLANVLREFLDRSQFIIITHKKRTMAAADVLYGITMQEAGISKQIAVRFEDWPEDEEKREAA